MTVRKEKKRIGVKYCGGCRVGYDRKAVLQSIREKSGGDFQAAEQETEYDHLLVLCNCTARCADYGAYRVRGNTVIVDHAPLNEELDEISRILSG